MSKKYSQKLLLAVLSALLLMFGATNSYADFNGTGLKPMSSEEWSVLKKNKVKRVRKNELGIERKNAELRRQGLPEIDSRDGATSEDEVELLQDGEVNSATEESAADIVEALPSAIDNSVLPSFPPVGNQGSEGSCVAWATTYYQMSHETCLARNCSNPAGASTIFAPRWTYNMINDGVDSGSVPSEAFQLLSRHGAPSHGSLPYTAGDYRKWDNNPAHWRSAISYRTNAMVAVTGLDTAIGVANLKQLLANGHVLTFATYVSSFVYTTVKNDPADPSPYANQQAVRYVNGSSGGHLMTIVGYNDSLWIDVNGNGVVDAGEKGAFKVANSWGGSWRNSGFIWVAYDALNGATRVVNGPSSSARTPIFRSYTAYHLTAKSSYQPKLLAEFTLSAAKRSQLSILLGSSSLSGTTPSATWTPGALRSQGGSYAFDGSTSAVDYTFAMDLTDLVPADMSSLKYYVKVTDSISGSPVTVKGFTLRNPSVLNTLNYSGSLPVSPDASTATLGISYASPSNIVPVAKFSVSNTSPLAGASVSFDASGSSDPDGSISSYLWNFGDGAGASGVVVPHVYAAAGSYTVILTVTDNAGATKTASAVVVVKAVGDSTAPTAPTGLSATTYNSTSNGVTTTKVSLLWKASTDNVKVTGYAVYRNGVLLTTTTSTFYTDSSTSKGITYTYYVKALDAAGNTSLASSSVKIVR